MEADRVTSRHLRSSTELLLLVPIKPGFVQVSELCSFASRLHTVLETLFELRRVAIERDGRPLRGPVERLQTIHRVQWTVLESERKLLVSAHFDRSWEDYFQLLVDINGPLLDLIFGHCEGFTGYSCADGYDRFAEFIRLHQQPCDFLYATASEQTVDDVRRNAKLAARRTLSTADSASMPIESVMDEAAAVDAALDAAGQEKRRLSLRDALIGLHDLRTRLFSNIEELPPVRGQQRTGEAMFDDAVRALLGTEIPATAGDADDFLDLLPKPVADWLRDAARPVAREPRAIPALAATDLAEIQGNILRGYDGKLHGCFVLMRCDDAQALGQLLRTLRRDVTTAQDPADDQCLNVALTYAGLQRLGLSSPVLAQFPKEFREGMEARAGLIGDVGSAHPSTWQRPRHQEAYGSPGDEVPLSAVDAVVIIQAPRRDDGSEWPADAALRSFALHAPAEGRHVLHVQPLRRYPQTESGRTVVREHFGFSESDRASSQPAVALPGQAADPATAPGDLVNPGELILGFENDRGHVAACADPATNPHSFQLFRNGSFLVVRKLQQNVADLNAYVEAFESNSDRPNVMARLIGRKVETGEPLLSPEAESARAGKAPNDFNFAGDDAGTHCPLHAHIRLANPRSVAPHARTKMPRIMRRGFSWGPRYDDDRYCKDRGLMFMAYNASIAGQYEVIQRWLNAGNSTGLSSAHNDLLSSTLPHTDVPRQIPVSGQLRNMPALRTPFVSLHWGMYLFVPSTRALEWLADQAEMDMRIAESQAAVDRGRRKVRELDDLAASDLEAAKREWKGLLEERANFRHASDLWRAVHADGGLKFTPYGVLVASAAGAQAVLGDRGRRFSVREYWRRLGSTTGPHYLAIDPEPGTVVRAGDRDFDTGYEAMLQAPSRYDALSKSPNEYLLSRLAPGAAFADAQRYAREFLANPGPLYNLGSDGARASVRVVDLARMVVARLSRKWLGLPQGLGTDEDLVESLDRFVRASRYSFQPHPEAFVGTDTQERVNRDDLRAEYRSGDGDLAAYLLGNKLASNAEAVDASIGAVVGFAAPAIGCVVSVVDLWTEDGKLAWHALLARSPQGQDRLLQALLAALVERPVPSILYRTATDQARIGDVAIPAGTTVVVSLSAAVLDTKLRNPLDTDAWRWLFGGAHGLPGDGNPPHGCPARQPAVGVLLGIVTGLLEQHDLRRERRGVLSYALRSTVTQTAG